MTMGLRAQVEGAILSERTRSAEAQAAPARVGDVISMRPRILFSMRPRIRPVKIVRGAWKIIFHS
jgi:hypothetical protein